MPVFVWSGTQAKKCSTFKYSHFFLLLFTLTALSTIITKFKKKNESDRKTNIFIRRRYLLIVFILNIQQLLFHTQLEL